MIRTALLTLILPGLALAQEPSVPQDEPTTEAAGEEPGTEAPADGEALPILKGPAIVEYVEAPYPAEAQEQGLEATVTLRIELDEEGLVQSLEVLEPQGHGFDEAAVDAVLQMVFSPAETEEGPVPVIFDFDYGFTFQPEEPEEGEPPPPAPVNFEGLIREMGTRKPIEGVKVVVDGTELVGETNAEGRFEIRGVPLGTATVRLLHTGHVPVDKELTWVEGEVTVVNLWLRSETYRDNEVVAVYDRKEEEVTRRTLSIEEVKRVPGTFGDPVKVIQTLPGAARSPFGTGLLVIRGSNPEDSGVYVDGIRIPIIYHLTGTTSVISPELIESVDYLPGGYGVQYGRSMGGVVDITTRDDFSEQGKLVWGTDILDSQLYYEGKVGKKKKHGVAVGARRSYIDALLPLVVPDNGFTLKPRYWDYQLKWVPELSGDETLSTFVYGFDDVLEVATPDDFAQGPDADTQGDFRTQYNSHRVIVRYTKQLTEDLSLMVLPSIGADSAYLGLGQEFVLDNWLYLGELRVETPWEASDKVTIVPGLDFFGGFWGFDFQSAIRITDIDDPLAERESIGFDGKGSFWSPDVFLKANIRPLDQRDKWLITPGIRLNNLLLGTGGEIAGADPVPLDYTYSLDPRLLTRFNTSEKLALKGAVGMYHQVPQGNEAVGVGTEATVAHELATNSSVGFEHRLSDAVHYDIDLFYKHMSDLILYDENWTGFGANPFFNGGDGRAYGLEVIARHEPVGNFFGWISYTLSRSARRDPPYCEEAADATALQVLAGTSDCFYLFDFDQTHILSAQGGYDLPKDFGVSAQVQYVTGNPSDPFNAGVYDADGDFYNGFATGGDNTSRLPSFFQTSLRFDKLFTFKRWQMETYVDMINVVRGINPELEVYNYDYSESAYVRGLPFIPNIGLEAHFHL